MTSGGAGGEAGEVGAGPVPEASRRLVQSLKEIVHRPEAEVYSALRECGMDPGEAVHLLLSQESDSMGTRLAVSGPGMPSTNSTQKQTVPSSSVNKNMVADMPEMTAYSRTYADVVRGSPLPVTSASLKIAPALAATAFAQPLLAPQHARPSMAFTQPRITLEKVDPFEGGGYGLETLYKEPKQKPDQDEIAVSYARFCLARSNYLKGKRDEELCHICFFKFEEAVPIPKKEMKGHCVSVHKAPGFECQKRRCSVRADNLGDAGIHHFYCHGQKTEDWWRKLLEELETSPED